jgi:hypothetical protein
VTLKVSGGLEVTPLKTFGTNLQQALSRHGGKPGGEPMVIVE